MLLNKLQEVLLEAGRENFGHTLCIWGKHGIGKTQVIESVAKQLSKKMRNLRLSQIDSTEVIGFPYRRKEVIAGTEYEFTDYAPPKWWIEAMQGNYIIFLDEINRAKPDVQQAVFELVQERRLNGVKLPDSVMIIAACNPDDAKYNTNSMDEAMMDRYVHLHLESNFEVFQNWARVKKESGKYRIAPEILNFLAADKSGQSFDKIEDSDRELPFTVTPSPRSWEKVNDIFALTGLSLDTRQDLITGVVGAEIAMGFVNSLRAGNKPVTLEEIIVMSPETVDKIKAYSMIDGEKDGKFSAEGGEQIVEMALLKHTCQEIAEPANSEVVLKNFDKVLEFLTLISSDMAQTALKMIINKDRTKRTFWDEKLKELATDKKGNLVPLPAPIKDVTGTVRNHKLRWEKLVAGLAALHEARTAMSTTNK